jgi:ABC-type multidrug transport system ATPase subunit
VNSRGGEPLLAARQVTRSYGHQRVLRGVDLELRAGEVVALLGPNGSGKTTLMSLLVGMAEPDTGTVVGDRDGAGWVPQGGATYSRLSVLENLQLFASLMGVAGDPAQVARDTAARAELDRWLHHTGSELSGGLRQRLNVSIGLLGDPDVIVLDEPTAGVDLIHRHAMWKVLRERADAGRAVLYSTHSLEDASFADRTCMLVDGCVVFDGDLAEVAQFAVPGAHAHVDDDVARGMLALWSRSHTPPSTTPTSGAAD